MSNFDYATCHNLKPSKMFIMDGQDQCLNNNKKIALLVSYGGFWNCKMPPSKVIRIRWHGFFQHLKSLF
jgi:hypothetical protein